MGMVEDIPTHAPDQHPSQPGLTARAEHDHVGGGRLRLLQDDVHGPALTGHRPGVDARCREACGGLLRHAREGRA